MRRCAASRLADMATQLLGVSGQWDEEPGGDGSIDVLDFDGGWLDG